MFYNRFSEYYPMEETLTPVQSSTREPLTEIVQNKTDIQVKAKKGKVSCKGLKDRALNPFHVKSIGITSNQQMFCLGTTEGIEVIQNDASCSQIDRSTFSTTSSVSLVKPVDEKGMFALVLEDEPNTVALCNQTKQGVEKNIEFESKVIELICTNGFLVIVLTRIIYVFKIDGLRCIDQIATCLNKKGLCGVSQMTKPSNKIIAAPSKSRGDIEIHEYDLGEKITHTIKAHQTKISALAVNLMGTLVASSSEIGTLIRIFSVEDGNVLQELRRGSSKADINNLIFHPTQNILACSSNKATIHLFEIKHSFEKCLKSKEYGFCRKESIVMKSNPYNNKKSSFRFLKFLSNFFNSEWSVTKIKVQNGGKVCGFDTKTNSLSIIAKGEEATICLYYIKIPHKTCRYMEDARIIKL